MYEVTLEPGGRRFAAPPDRNLLQAALGAGASLPYGCANGSCGDCRARVVAGSVVQVAHSDFPIPRAERDAGTVLLCCSGAASDLTLEIGEARSAADLPHQSLRVRLQKVEPLGDGVLLVQARTPRSQLLRYLSGQRVRLTLDTGASAELALASCPCEGLHLTFHARREPGSAFVQALLVARRGASAELEGPYGDFTLVGEATRPILLLAVDTGLAAIESLCAQIVNLELSQPVTLVWYASQSVGHYRHNHLRALRDALDGFAYHPIGAEEATPAAVVAAVAATVPAPLWAQAEIYVAGGTASDALVALAIASGAEAARVRAEVGP